MCARWRRCSARCPSTNVSGSHRPARSCPPMSTAITLRPRSAGAEHERGGDDYLFFLTYGSDVQWVKNVLVAGSCSLEMQGKLIQLVEPELINDAELRPAPTPVRFIEGRIAGATRYLRMRCA